MSSRESARREWRANVARAAEAWERIAVPCGRGLECRCIFRRARRLSSFMREEPGLSPPEDHRAFIAANALRAALAKPKPWARPRAGADLGKWGPFEALRRDMRVGPSGLTFREFCRQGYGAPCLWRAMDTLRRKRRAAQRRRRTRK